LAADALTTYRVKYSLARYSSAASGATCPIAPAIVRLPPCATGVIVRQRSKVPDPDQSSRRPPARSAAGQIVDVAGATAGGASAIASRNACSLV